MKQHHYTLQLTWTGNTGHGTANYRSYERSHVITAFNKPDLLGSSDPAFRGDSTKYNPEELLVASLSSCHMLWFLHLCADNGIVVTDYLDEPVGVMVETIDGGGRFSEVTLKPRVTVTKPGDLEVLEDLHYQANKLCFIANSVNFPVHHQASGQLSV
jgi:organic hydroperoxide reductase OsmC/OhrA